MSGVALHSTEGVAIRCTYTSLSGVSNVCLLSRG